MWVCIKIIFLIILGCSNVSADSIELRSGKVFEGEIVSYKNKKIVLQSKSGELHVKSRMVNSVIISEETENKKELLTAIYEDLGEMGIRRKDSNFDRSMDAGYVQSESRGPVVYRNNLDFQNDNINSQKIDSKKSKRLKSKKKKVEVYMSPTCGYCRKAIALLKKNRIRFKSYNINSDRVARARYKRLGGKGVPLIVVDGSTVLRGYNEQGILDACE